MVTFEELKAKYPVREVPPHGNCLVVPEREFLDGWESELKAQGVAVLYHLLPGGPCVVLKVKGQKLEGHEPHLVYEPPKPGQTKSESLRTQGFHRWTDADDELIRKMWNEGCKASEIIQKFPGLSPHALYQRFSVLKRNGVIGPRGKNGQPLEPEAPAKVDAKASADACTGKCDLNITLTITAHVKSVEQLDALHRALKEAGLVG